MDLLKWKNEVCSKIIWTISGGRMRGKVTYKLDLPTGTFPSCVPCFSTEETACAKGPRYVGTNIDNK